MMIGIQYVYICIDVDVHHHIHEDEFGQSMVNNLSHPLIAAFLSGLIKWHQTKA